MGPKLRDPESITYVRTGTQDPRSYMFDPIPDTREPYRTWNPRSEVREPVSGTWNPGPDPYHVGGMQDPEKSYLVEPGAQAL